MRDSNVVEVIAVKTPKRIGQHHQLCDGPFTQFRQFPSRNESTALCHYRMQERFGRPVIVVSRHDIVIESLIVAVLPINLFAAGPGGFPF
jgi:hypothetical protein